jgi:hypothetical protein
MMLNGITNIEVTDAVDYAELKAAAEKGYAWLLESGPQCGLDVTRIDSDTLDLSSSCRCVLGQLGGVLDFEDTLDQIAATVNIEGDFEARRDWASEHGFFVTLQTVAPSVPDMREFYRITPWEQFEINAALDRVYKGLTDAWREVIAERAQQEGD